MKQVIKLENGRKKVVTVNDKPSKTDTSFKDQCDINKIMAKFKKTGQINHLAKRQGVFADVSQMPDLLQYNEKLTELKSTFGHVPAAARKKFDNDPLKMANWLKDPANKEEAIKLGLLVAPPQEAGETKPEGAVEGA